MKKNIIIFYMSWFLIFFTLMFILTNIEENTIIYSILNFSLGLTIISFPISIIVFCILRDILLKNKKKEMFNNLSIEEKQKYYLKQEQHKLILQKAKSDKLKQERIYKQQITDRKTIVKTIIVGTNGKIITDANDSLIGGLVGGTLFGTIGAIAGASSGDKRIINKTTFLIKYADGHKEIKTVKNNSYKFNKLCKYLEI